MCTNDDDDDDFKIRIHKCTRPRELQNSHCAHQQHQQIFERHECAARETTTTATTTTIEPLRCNSGNNNNNRTRSVENAGCGCARWHENVNELREQEGELVARCPVPSPDLCGVEEPEEDLCAHHQTLGPRILWGWESKFRACWCVSHAIAAVICMPVVNHTWNSRSPEPRDVLGCLVTIIIMASSSSSSSSCRRRRRRRWLQIMFSTTHLLLLLGAKIMAPASWNSFYARLATWLRTPFSRYHTYHQAACCSFLGFLRKRVCDFFFPPLNFVLVPGGIFFFFFRLCFG